MTLFEKKSVKEFEAEGDLVSTDTTTLYFLTVFFIIVITFSLFKTEILTLIISKIN